MTTITESNLSQTLDLSGFSGISLPALIVEYPTRADFPSIGKADRLYHAMDEGMPYRWSSSANAYALMIPIIDAGAF